MNENKEKITSEKEKQESENYPEYDKVKNSLQINEKILLKIKPNRYLYTKSIAFSDAQNNSNNNLPITNNSKKLLSSINNKFGMFFLGLIGAIFLILIPFVFGKGKVDNSSATLFILAGIALGLVTTFPFIKLIFDISKAKRNMEYFEYYITSERILKFKFFNKKAYLIDSVELYRIKDLTFETISDDEYDYDCANILILYANKGIMETVTFNAIDKYELICNKIKTLIETNKNKS